MNRVCVHQKFTQWDEPYVELQAIDMDCERVMLRLWLFEERDFYDGMLCIIRGLKVVAERTNWDDWAWSYPGEVNARHTLECVQHRTAVEDVSHVDGIRAIFQ